MSILFDEADKKKQKPNEKQPNASENIDKS